MKRQIQSWAPEKLQPATTAGFSFNKTVRDKMGTQFEAYKPAEIHRGSKWFVYFSYRMPNGKFKRFKIYFEINRIKDLKEREKYAQALKEATNDTLASGIRPIEADEEQPDRVWTLIQSLNYFKTKIPELGLRKRTEDTYTSLLAQFTTAFKSVHHKPINEITRNDCQSVLSALKKERSWGNTMFNNGLTFGRLVFSYLIQNGVTKDNPFKQIKSLQETKTQNQPFSNEHFELIKKEADPELLRFLMFLYYSGTRPNEARQLKYENILRDRKMLFIPGSLSKGKKDGFVPVPDQFLEMFQGEGVIFGKSKNHFTNQFTSLKRRLKLPEQYTLYSIKATRAVHLAEDGASPYAVMQLFRHSSLEITMQYLRGLGVNIGREAAEKSR